MILDTTFLIDLHREAVRNEPAKAFTFLERNADAPMRISIITYAEFAEGFSAESYDRFLELVSPYEVVDISKPIAWKYAQLSRDLRKQGSRIGDNDLWIAATAIDSGAPLVTRDNRHFPRVAGLTLLSY